MSTEISQKELLRMEYIKCYKDPIYFLRKYAKIQHPKRGKLPFELYDFQEKCLDQFLKNDYSIVLKSRQLGISTLVAGLAFHMMIFHPDSNILVIAKDQKTSKTLVTKVRVMYKNLPAWMQLGVEEDNKLSLRLTNGSQIVAAAATEDSGRSEALSMLILDEAASTKYIDQIWAAVQPTLATGGRCIILSTPAGVGNFFHKTWVDAETGENNFFPIKLMWHVHPDRDQAWFDKQKGVFPPKYIAQEYCCDFLSSGDTVVDPEHLTWYKDNLIREPIMKRYVDNNLWVWEHPQNGHSYLVSADVSRGDGSDFSAFHVIDLDTMEQVAEYKGKIDTKSYGNLLVAVATEYNDALLVVENASIGWAAIQQILDRRYKNLFYTYKDDGYIDHKQFAKRYDMRKKEDMVPGFTTSTRTRPLIIEKLEEVFRERQLKLYSSRSIDELFTFIWRNNRAQAMDKYNDDLVMSLAIGLWIRDTAIRLRQRGIDHTNAMLNGITRTGAVYKSQGSYGSQNQWNVPMGRDGSPENLEWLIDKK